ncbi:hypothetical protein HUJ05_005582 [Dendroctonus ponderosae]|nr:hypothetical protein HUJ05_005582 [Dendroctonus ponderosae]
MSIVGATLYTTVANIINSCSIWGNIFAGVLYKKTENLNKAFVVSVKLSKSSILKENIDAFAYILCRRNFPHSPKKTKKSLLSVQGPKFRKTDRTKGITKESRHPVWLHVHDNSKYDQFMLYLGQNFRRCFIQKDREFELSPQNRHHLQGTWPHSPKIEKNRVTSVDTKCQKASTERQSPWQLKPISASSEECRKLIGIPEKHEEEVPTPTRLLMPIKSPVSMQLSTFSMGKFGQTGPLIHRKIAFFTPIRNRIEDMQMRSRLGKSNNVDFKMRLISELKNGVAKVHCSLTAFNCLPIFNRFQQLHIFHMDFFHRKLFPSARNSPWNN